jgi:hypothetical protein
MVSDGAQRLDTLGLALALTVDEGSRQMGAHLVVRSALAALMAADL